MGIADDIVVCGSIKPEHGQALCKMLEATRKQNVILNSEKLQKGRNLRHPKLAERKNNLVKLLR